MNSNMKVGPSFEGTFQLKTIKRFKYGKPVYGQVEEIKLPDTEDRAINSALVNLLKGKSNTKVPVVKDRLESTLKYISRLIKQPLEDLYKAGETWASGDIFNQTKMTFKMERTYPRIGDRDLFWVADKPFDTLRVDISDADIVELVREARSGK